MKLLLALLACAVLVSCGPQKRPTQVAPVEKPQTTFIVQVDERLMPPPEDRMPMNFQIKKELAESAQKLGIPLQVWRVTNAAKPGPECVSNLWNATCSVEGVDDIDTLKCIGNTLIRISYVCMVGTHDFQVFKPRRCGNTGVDPADVKRMEELKKLGEQLQDTTPPPRK